MYIEYKANVYPCFCMPGREMVYSGLPDDFPAPVDDIIKLCADDGFVLREDDPSDYLRQEFGSGGLMLTNVPAPSAPEPLTAEQQRELAYNAAQVIAWNGEMLTVTQAALHWQYYAAEGSTKADDLRALIAAAKAQIRAEYPDM